VVLTQQTGGFTLVTEPAGAMVFLDGASLGQVTPMRVGSVAAGQHTIELRLGARILTQTITVEAGKTVDFKVPLPPEPASKPVGETSPPEKVAVTPPVNPPPEKVAVTPPVNPPPEKVAVTPPVNPPPVKVTPPVAVQRPVQPERIRLVLHHVSLTSQSAQRATWAFCGSTRSRGPRSMWMGSIPT
jgi:hypothetical protein